MFQEEGRVKRLPYLGLGILVVGVVVFLLSIGSIYENMDAEESIIVQDAIDGELHAYTGVGGMKPQWFGKVTKYPKRSIYEFETSVRFNDGGSGTMKGSIQYEMPTSEVELIRLHTQFKTAENVQNQLVKTVTNKAVYMTGPLMSSRESYAEKRNYLINYVEDQINRGVYKTVQRDVRVLDPLTGQEKSAVVVEIVMENGQPQRQEESALLAFGIKPFNFAIHSLDYDKKVESQIDEQQAIVMAVQTSIANARKAEQRKLTVEQEGAANAAEAKWAQEVEKAKAVTLAEQQVEVARLNVEAAEMVKQKDILLGQGLAEQKRLIMNADGALVQKLEAYVAVNEKYAEAIAKYQGNWVPTFVFGGDGGGTGNGANALVNLLTAKAAKDLALDLGTVKGTAGKKED